MVQAQLLRRDWEQRNPGDRLGPLARLRVNLQRRQSRNLFKIAQSRNQGHSGAPSPSIGVICILRVSELRAPSSVRPFHLARRGSDQHADYVLVQHIQHFLRLLERDSVRQFEANLNAPKRGNRVMIRPNFDYDRPGLPANPKTNTCSFDLSCRHIRTRCAND